MLILIAIGWVAVWSNHFGSGFHYDDFPGIVDNPSVHHLASVPRFFINPRISSAEKDSASYHPLLSAWFAFDYWLSGDRPFFYQLENWIWFALDVLMLFLLIRAIPGVNGYAAGFAALLFGVHPVMADTVNYVLQRGPIFGMFCVTSALVIFIYWPWRLPQKLPLKLKRVPEHGWDEYLRHNFQRFEAIYLKMIHAPSGLYLWPMVPALLVEPATAVFAPILAVYIVLFEQKRSLKNAIPAAVLCGAYWLFQLAFTWNLGELRLAPAANYLFSQPWVALRYLGKFFVPVNLSVAANSTGFAHFWDPLALAGFAGVGLLTALAVIAARTAKWRVVSFGIWWFLIALLPTALTPHQEIEAEWRMFLPFAGLALAIGGLVSLAIEALPGPAREDPDQPVQPSTLVPYFGAGVLAVAVLSVLGWGTFQRSAVWSSEAALWRAATQASPQNGRAIMRYGIAQLNTEDAAPALDFLRRANQVTPGDPLIEINLAKVLERRSQTGQAEMEFRNAIAHGPAWSRGYSVFGEWLMQKTRAAEAETMARKALQLDPYDNTARRTVMDFLAQDHQWDKLKQFAADTLHREPGDADGLRSMEVAQTGIDQVDKAAHAAKYEPTVDNYLALSVKYFDTHQYEDCIAAAKEALKINPNQAEAYANLASAYHTLGKLDESLAALREENRLNPNLPNAKSNLAIVEGEVARRDAAKQPTSEPTQ